MAKKRKKKKNFKGLIIGLLFIFILALVGYLGYRSYVEIQGIVSDIENFEYNIPDDISSNITFPTKESGIYSIVSKKAFPTAQLHT